MPDKRQPCGSGCLRCWQNRLKHANPIAKRKLLAEKLTWSVEGERREFKCKRNTKKSLVVNNTGHKNHIRFLKEISDTNIAEE